MLYPAYVELGDENEAYSVVLPDFEGCFTATDNEQDLPRKVQEAVELHFNGENFNLPPPSLIKDLKTKKIFDYDGVFMMFEINTSKLKLKSN